MGAIRLEVYVDDECLACSRSLAVAAQVQDAFPDVDVAVLRPDSDEGAHRHLVAAVPTYILNGRVISLGNPTLAELSDAIVGLATGAQRW